jgi:hypothetical protein
MSTTNQSRSPVQALPSLAQVDAVPVIVTVDAVVGPKTL